MYIYIYIYCLLNKCPNKLTFTNGKGDLQHVSRLMLSTVISVVCAQL